MKPKLRFKNFNSDWINCTIKDVADVIGGGTPDTSNSKFWNGNINWFTPSEVGKSKYVSNSERKITELGVQKSSAKLLPIGAILLSSRATVGEASILEKNQACTNQGFKSLVAHKNIDTEFLYYLKDKYKREMLNKAFGSTFLEISKSNIEKIKIKIPSIEEQIKISNFLSLLDKKIELQTKKIEDLKLFKLCNINRFINDGNEIKVKLLDIGKFYRGLSYNANNVTKSGLLVLRSNNIDNNEINYCDLQFVNKKCSNDIILKNGDIVICMANGSRKLVGKAGTYTKNKNYNDITVGAFCSIYRSDRKYAKYFFQSKSYIKQLDKMFEGTNINNLKNSNLENLTFGINNDIEKYTSFLEKLDLKLHFENKKLNELLKLKKGLMQNMFV